MKLPYRSFDEKSKVCDEEGGGEEEGFIYPTEGRGHVIMVRRCSVGEGIDVKLSAHHHHRRQMAAASP
jgi:hypothetical protein